MAHLVIEQDLDALIGVSPKQIREGSRSIPNSNKYHRRYNLQAHHESTRPGRFSDDAEQVKQEVSASLETRVQTLETKLNNLDKKIERLLDLAFETNHNSRISCLVAQKDHIRRSIHANLNPGLPIDIHKSHFDDEDQSTEEHHSNLTFMEDFRELYYKIRTVGYRATIRYYLIEGLGRIGKFIEMMVFVLIIWACVMFVLTTKPMYYENLIIEWFLTAIFTIEYSLRVYATQNRMRYVLSFYGIIDFLSIFPMYVETVFGTASVNLKFMRGARTLRAVKLLSSLEPKRGQSHVEIFGCKVSKMVLQMFRGICTLLIIWFCGAGFFIFFEQDTVDDFFVCYYFMVVSATTVGYGDITPQTHMGRFIMMLVLMVFFMSVPYLASQISQVYAKYEELEAQKALAEQEKFVEDIFAATAKGISDESPLSDNYGGGGYYEGYDEKYEFGIGEYSEQGVE